MILDNKPTLRAILYSITGFSLFAIGDSIFKFLSPYYSVYLLVFYSSLLIMFFLSLTAPFLGGMKTTLKSKYLKLHLIRGVLFFIQITLFLYGISHISLAKAYALVFIAPFITSLLSIPLLKEHVTIGQWVAITVGFTGVLVILRPGMIPLDMATIAVLCAALFFSLANIAARFIGDDETLLSWGLIPEFVIFICALGFVLPEVRMPETEHMGLIAFLSAASAAGMIFVALSFVKAPAAIVAPFHYIQMVWAIILGYLIFNETLDIWTSGGAAIIIGSGIWMIRHEKASDITATQTAHPVPLPEE